MVTFRLIVVMVFVIAILESSFARKSKRRRTTESSRTIEEDVKIESPETQADKADKHESDKDEKGSDEGSNEGASDIDDLLDNLDNDEEMEANEAEIPIEQPEDENRFDEILHPGGSTEPEEDSPIEEEEERKRDDVGDIEASAEKDVSFKRAENDNDSLDEGNDRMSNEYDSPKKPDDGDESHFPYESQENQDPGSHETKSEGKHESQEVKHHKHDKHDTHEEDEPHISHEDKKLPSHEMDEESVKVDCEMGPWEEWSSFKCINPKGLKVWHSNCGICKRGRKKIVVKECENGGDCSCKNILGVDKKRRRCKHRKIPAADPPASEGLPVPTDLGKRHPPCRTDEACKKILGQDGRCGPKGRCYEVKPCKVTKDCGPGYVCRTPETIQKARRMKQSIQRKIQMSGLQGPEGNVVQNLNMQIRRRRTKRKATRGSKRIRPKNHRREKNENAKEDEELHREDLSGPGGDDSVIDIDPEEYPEQDEKDKDNNKEDKDPRNISGDKSDISASDIRSDQGGMTDSISISTDDGKGSKPSNENLQQGDADVASEISDETPKETVVDEPPKLPEIPNNVKTVKKVCVRKQAVQVKVPPRIIQRPASLTVQPPCVSRAIHRLKNMHIQDMRVKVQAFSLLEKLLNDVGHSHQVRSVMPAARQKGLAGTQPGRMGKSRHMQPMRIPINAAQLRG